MRSIYFTLILSFFTYSSFAFTVPTGALGGGYSTDGDQALPIMCLNAGPVFYTGSNIGKVDYAQSYDLSDVQTQLGITVKLHVGFGLFSMNNDFNFAKTTSQQTLAETLIYRSTYQFKDSNYAIPTSGPILSPVGQQYESDPTSFRRYCGDSYIAQLHNGAYLYIAFQLQFLSKEDQEKFNNHFSADFSNIFKLTNDITHQIQNQHIQGSIHLMAVQEGGDPTQLGHIINKGTALCSLNNMSACVDEMQTILSYINGDMGKSSFPGQLDDGTKGAVPPINAAIVGYEPYDYNAIIHIQSKSKLTPAIIVTRDQLGDSLKTYMTLFNHATYVRNMAVDFNYVYDLYKDKLNDAIYKVQQNIRLLQVAGQTCFDNLDQCLSMAEQTASKIQPVTAHDIVLPTTLTFTETYIDGTQVPEIFVDAGTASSQGELYRGTIAVAGSSSTPEYDVYIQNNGAAIAMVKYDHITLQLLAVYRGTSHGKDHFSGTVNYPGIQKMGSWSGTLIPSQSTLINGW